MDPTTEQRKHVTPPLTERRKFIIERLLEKLNKAANNKFGKFPKEKLDQGTCGYSFELWPSGIKFGGTAWNKDQVLEIEKVIDRISVKKLVGNGMRHISTETQKPLTDTQKELSTSMVMSALSTEIVEAESDSDGGLENPIEVAVAVNKIGEDEDINKRGQVEGANKRGQIKEGRVNVV